MRASKIMQQRVLENPKIHVMYNTHVTELHGEDKLSLVRTNQGDLDATGLFIAIGHNPRSELVMGQTETDKDGYVTVQHPTTATGVPGVFACGDLVDNHYRQAITAAGTGAAAALDAEKYLADLPVA